MSRVAVVIPSWNGRHLLQWCLQAVFRQDEPDLEVVLVDNGSSDGTVSWLASSWPQARVLPLLSNHGFSGAMNAGIAVTTGRFVLALNNDAAPERTYVRTLADWLDAHPSAAACQGRILRHDDPSVVDSLGIVFDGGLRAFQLGSGARDPGPCGTPRRVAGVSASAALYRRTALTAVADAGVPPAVFDPGFFAYYEDVDLALRLGSAGWTAWLVPQVACEHLGSATGIEGSWRKAYLLGRNHLLYLARHSGLGGLLSRTPRLGARVARRLLTVVLHPRRDLALTLGELAAIPRLPAACRKCRPSPSSAPGEEPSRPAEPRV